MNRTVPGRNTHPTQYTKHIIYMLFYFILLCLHYYIYSMEIKYHRQKKSKKAVFKSKWWRNGQSRLDHEISVKSQRLSLHVLDMPTQYVYKGPDQVSLSIHTHHSQSGY